MTSKIFDGDAFTNSFTKYNDTTRKLICSSIPDACRNEPCLLGVDEAGRGPVLGPMVYGISFCPLNKKDEFADLGCADSKALTEKKREDVFAIICACEDYVGWAVDIISPNFISNCMLRRAKHSLNEVAADSTIALIKKVIDEGVNVAEIYVDTVGPPEKYQERLSKHFPDCKVTVAKKADSLYPIVSAASICAKVCRDRVISSWNFTEEIEVQCDNYGSGYPAGRCAAIKIRNYATCHKPVKTAIVMMNMGGPQHTDQVHEYLHRIMTDRDMIQLPVQGTLGPLIAKRRAPEVAKKYAEIGGGSPILRWTNLQGELLCQKLDEICPETAPHRHYVAFRYADPLTDVALQQIERDGAERVVLFSQYPHYSCATSGSSFNAIYTHYSKQQSKPNARWSIIDRWSTHPLLAQTFADNIRKELDQFPEAIRKEVLILFSAHSLPLKAVNRGDAYPSEVGATVQLVMDQLNHCNPYSLVWQSRVGPLPWLAPYTDEALKGYVQQGKKNFLLVPIAFVNEHIETLHEMDIEYCHDLAKEIGVENIRRVAAPNDHPLFIEALVDIVKKHLHSGQRISPKFLSRCPHCVNARCGLSKEWFSQVCG